MPKIVVVGGGWGGCAAALVAAKQGADVTLIERTDMLLGTGLVGGIFRNNGRFTAAEEALAMGGGDLFEVMEANAVHRNIEFPGHKHAWLYNVNTIERAVRKRLDAAGVDVRMMTRITEVEVDGERILSVAVAEGADAERFAADAFVDSTGTSGVPRTCNQHGNGCSMCVLRCHTFGNRVSVAGRAGLTEMVGHKGTQVGAMSGACKIVKDSLAPEIAEALNRDGVFVAAIPAELRAGEDKLGSKCCQQYATADYADNIVLLDTGHAKLMTTHIPLDRLHQVPGFENARYQDPISGGIGNSIRFVAMTPRDDALKADGLDNLFVAGEKAGLLVGHTEAIVTGLLAGHNAVREAVGDELCVLPDSLAIGDAITHVRERMQTEEGLGLKYTFSGSVYFDRMKERGLYVIDVADIRARVEAAGLTNVFGAPTVTRRRPARVAGDAAAVAAE
ncbi:MAG: FAD-dependent oxidoreductase [Rhodoplanes sp.]|uniref:FAD-dependent oxidoreductase n=1 Tax=Rhodoplanes sp. TaxID=1968906 RepID=UPI00180BEFFB|nr:FAD-dependent oxidoreductase [Rhodoplanes sp.]NVO14883.1 FAD-dependent oxidoreductase [Rhodoplanes sp.]